MNGHVVPLAAPTDKDGFLGYKSMIIVKTGNPFQSLGDVKAKRLGLSDPKSTSGNQAPRFFLKEDGIDIDSYFKSATFSGSHENSVMGLMNGAFDCVAVPWYSENETIVTRMERKGLVPAGSCRIIWQSPMLPASPFAVPAWLPDELREEIRTALLEMPKRNQELFKSLYDGRAKSIEPVSRKDYDPVVRMIRENLETRTNS